MSGITSWTGGLMAALAVAGTLRAAEPVTPEQFEKLRQVIKPHGDELKWMQIPWLADLWEARKQAAEQGKPILLWEMDGHPLGCT